MPKPTNRPPRRAAGTDRSIFEHSAVSLWEEDISGLRALLREWRSRGIFDLRAYLLAHPAQVRRGVKAIRVIDVNEAAVSLYEAKSKRDLLGPLAITLDAASLNDFVGLFTAVAEGRGKAELESTALTLGGKKLSILVRATIPAEQDVYPYMLVSVVDVSALKERERKLSHERSMMRAVIDSVPDQIFVKGRDGKFLLVNKALVGWAGENSAEKLIGKRDHDYFPREVADAFHKDDVAIIKSRGAKKNYEEDLVSSDGRHMRALTTKVPFRGPSGKITGIVGIVRDITERKALERAIEEERALLRAVINTFPDLILVKDRETRFMLANKPVAGVMRAGDPENLIGKTDADFYPLEMAMEFAADERGVMEKGARLINKEECRTVDGVERWFLTTKVPLVGADGSTTGLVGVSRDITSLREAQDALRRSEDNYRTIYMDAPVGIFSAAPDGALISVNPAVARMMGYDFPVQLMLDPERNNIIDILFEGRTDRAEVISEVMKDSLWHRRENRFHRRDGQVVAASIMMRSFLPPGASQRQLEGFVVDITERVRAEKALQESQERYRSLVENLGVGIVTTDHLGTITFTNPALGQIFGLPRGASLGRNLKEFLTEEASARVREEIALRGQGGKSSYEIEIVRTDKEKRRVLVSAVSRFDDSGAYAGTFATLQDLTDRYRVETELSRQRVLMQALMDGIPDHIYFKDIQGRFMLNSRAHAKQLGVDDPAGMLGKNDFDYFPLDFAQQALSDERRIIATGEPIVDKVERAVWADRPSMWVSSTKMPLRNADGSIIGTFGISRDITERRQIEEKNLRLAAMVDSSNDAIIGTDLTATVTSWNKGAEKTFGYAAEEMIGRPITPILSPEILTRGELQEELRRQGSVQRLESTVTRKDGKTIHLSSSFSFVRDAGGQTVGITCISRDVTEQRALQAQVIRAQRLESLGTLAAGIAHQFNNINAAVKGYLDFVVQDTDLAASSRLYIQEALKAVQRSVDITERLQGLTGGSGAAWEIMHLEEAIPAFLRLITQDMEKQGIAVAVDMQKTLPIRASRSMLAFIFTTLMSNAAHALLDRPSPAITVRVRSAGDFSALEVSDNGWGIPAGDLGRIFSPFFTTKGEWAEPGSSQVRVKGVGLSLAVCQSSVAESGGWIEVESTQGAGTTFHVWFPAASEQRQS